jgi:ankyrin repeat protein
MLMIAVRNEAFEIVQALLRHLSNKKSGPFPIPRDDYSLRSFHFSG